MQCKLCEESFVLSVDSEKHTRTSCDQRKHMITIYIRKLQLTLQSDSFNAIACKRPTMEIGIGQIEMDISLVWETPC